MFSHASRFESLGANCEFGFFLRRCGNETGSAFRWTDIPSSSALIKVVDNNLGGMFEYGNLRPFNAKMVLDSATGFGWHSYFRSRIIDKTKMPNPENFEFTTPEAEREVLWKVQIEKVNYLVAKTRDTLKSNSKIFVFKPTKKDKEFNLERGAEIFEAIRRHGSNKLLIVTEARAGDIVGDVNELKSGLLHGIIDRFAPGGKARDISFEGWLRVCERAYAALEHDVAKVPICET